MGEGSVYQRRSDGRWVAQFPDRQGRRRYRYRNTRTEARQALRDALDKRDRGASGDDPTLEAWAGWWLDQLDRRPTTVADYRYKIGLLPPWLTRKRLSELSPMDVHEALRELAGGTNMHGRPRASSTVAQVRTVLGNCLHAAERYGHVTRNAARLAAPVTVTETEVVPLTVDQAAALLEACEGHPLHSLYVVAVTTGMRQGELLGLRWPSVDLEQGVVEVTVQRTRTNTGQVVEGVPKTRRSRRRVLLPEVACEALRERKRGRGTVVALDGLVWATSTGSAYQPSNVRRHLSRACVRAGVPRVTFHTLRHSAATIMLALGVPETTILDVLGHTDGRMLRRYAHVTDSLRESAAGAMDGAFTDSRDSV